MAEREWYPAMEWRRVFKSKASASYWPHSPPQIKSSSFLFNSCTFNDFDCSQINLLQENNCNDLWIKIVPDLEQSFSIFQNPFGFNSVPSLTKCNREFCIFRPVNLWVNRNSESFFKCHDIVEFWRISNDSKLSNFNSYRRRTSSVPISSEFSSPAWYSRRAKCWWHSPGWE